MTIAVRHYASGAENIASANAIRQRLMKPANAYKAPVALVVSNPQPPRRHERPLWQRQGIDFDEHVKNWQWHRITIKSNRYKEYIIKRCIELCVDYHEITGPSLLRSLTGPRQLIWYEMKTILGLSYPRIAREFGDRDHTTVMSGVQRVAKLRGESYPEKLNSQDRLLQDRDLNERIRADYKAGSPIDVLGVKFGISPKAISAVARIENWSRDRRDRKTKSRALKYSIADVRRDFERGRHIKAICDDHKICDRTIRRLAAEHGWTRKEKE